MNIRSTRTSLIALALSLPLSLPMATGATARPMDAPRADAAASRAQATGPAGFQPAPVSELVDEVSIPYDMFTLDNGLTVLVHEDRKAPVVAVSVWYAVGSKNEPRGKTGFAHLFEHLMFNGSENAPGDFFEPLQQVGATDFNGTTWFDRTNYFETVPTGALDRALFLESDRMGHLLDAVTQEKLDNQRGVVQNEKRQGDNQPYGIVEYEQLENLYPSGHPYHHSTIGSMADLDSATLDDVKGWFRDHYGPNNAILVLAGDIDTATARQKVTKWFGAIPAGPKVEPIAVPVPTLDQARSKIVHDRIATPRVYRMWAVPGLDNPESLPLSIGANVLGGLASSRLENALVRGRELAVRVSASPQIFAQGGQMVIYADAKPGVGEEELAAALDQEIAEFVAEGPTRDELQRAVTTYAAGQIQGLEQVGGFSGKAPTLAESLLYQGDPAAYKRNLERAAALTPTQVREAMQKWLSRPVFALTVAPGEREEGGENRGGYIIDPADGGLAGPAYYQTPGTAQPPHTGQGAPVGVADADRSKLPDVGTLQPLDFPTIERATLANGMKVYFARRAEVPVVTMRVQFDAGYAADPRDELGLQSLMLAAMDEGTTDLDATELAEAEERLGASIYGMADMDNTAFQLDTVTPNMAAATALLADYIRNPAFRGADLERVRTQQITRIENELNNPGAIASRALQPIIYGANHPYGIAPSGTGNVDSVRALTAEELRGFHDRWLRPDNARIFVVGDTTLADVTRQLEASFADWKAPAGPVPTKNFDVAVPTQQPRIVLIDRPNSPQSIIMAGRVLDDKGTDDLITLRAANDVFGGSFLSRINMNLRETKGWSYGVRSSVAAPIDRAAFIMFAPVQSDRTGDSIVELRKDLDRYTTGGEGVTSEELVRTVNGNVRELPGQFETSGDVLSGIVNIVDYDRPDDYYETLADRYRDLSAQAVDAEALKALVGTDLVFVVVGDAAKIRPQLEQLGLPIEEREAQ